VEHKINIRRLLAGSSLVALLAASNGVLYDNEALAAGASATGIPISFPNAPTSGSIFVSSDIFSTAYTTAPGSATSASPALATAVGLFANLGGLTVTTNVQNTGTIVAGATVSINGPSPVGTAEAYGMEISSTGPNLGTLSVENDIRAYAVVNAYGTQDVPAVGHAYALGVGLDISSGSASGIFNSASVLATAVVHSYPVGSPPPPGATATGMSLSVGGTVTATPTSVENTGVIQALAIDPGEATARGVNIDGGTYLGDFVNSGSIFARAEATATSGVAVATGLGLHGASNTSVFDGAIRNSGTIFALATGDQAHAVGVLLEDSSYVDGGLINSGVIAATANGTSTASATAVKVTSSADLGGTLSNTGVIAAAVNGTLGAGVAINLEGANGGTLIEQLSGAPVNESSLANGIYGSILLNNGNSDTLEWSGGLIDGNIHGDSYDTLDVFSGVDSQFTFDGNINVNAVVSESGTSYTNDAQAFGAINVNTAGHSGTAVALKVSGHIYAGDLNIHNNGTLEVAPSAAVAVDNLTVAGNGETAIATLQFDIKPSEPQNGTITAGTVTFGSGAVIAAHEQPGLFGAHEDFLVIASTDVSGTAGFTEDFTDLYTVSKQQEADGVHVILDRMSFADIPGLTGNGAAIGAGIDQILNTLNQTDPDGPLATLLNQVLTGTPEEYAAAMNALSGSQNAELLQAISQDPGQLLNIIFGQLGGGGGGGTGVADIGTRVQIADNNVSATASDAPPAYASLMQPTAV